MTRGRGWKNYVSESQIYRNFFIIQALPKGFRSRIISMGEIFANGLTGTIGRNFDGQVRNVALRLDQLHDKVLDKNLNFMQSSFIHCAGVVGKYSIEVNLEYSRKVNVLGPTLLAEQLLERGLRTFVYVSSGHVYGSSSNDSTELSRVNPQTIYAEQKLEAEDLLKKTFLSTNANLIIARVFSVIHMGMPPETLGGKLQRIYLGNTSEKVAYADDIRDFLSPKSVAEILFKLSKVNCYSGIINVCSGTPMSIFNLAKLILTQNRTWDKKLTISGHSQFSRIVGDSSNLQKLIGIQKPELALDEILVERV